MSKAFISKLSDEDRLQIAVGNYLNFRRVLWFHPQNEGKRNWAALKYASLMGSKRGLPDVLIFKPMGGYNGLALELKAKNIYKKDGGLYADPHLQEQALVLKEFEKNGWMAHFAIGIDDSMSKINTYLSEKKDT